MRIRFLLLIMCGCLFAPVQANDQREALKEQLRDAKGRERIQLLLDIGKSYSYQNTDEMIRYSEMAETEAREQELPDLVALAIQNQGTGLFQAAKFDEALEQYERGLKAGQAVGDDSVIGSCINGIAAVNLHWGNLDVALENFREAAIYLDRLEDRSKLASCISNISVIFYNRGDYQTALDYMYQALGLYEEAGDKTGSSVVLNSIGAVHGRLNQLEKAVEIFKRGLILARETDNFQLIAIFLVNIGEQQRIWGETEAARKSFEEALEYARKLGNQDLLAVCLNNIGEVMRTEGQYRNAMQYFKETLKLFEDAQSKPRIFSSYMNIGYTHMDLEEYDEAETFMLKAYELAKELESKTNQKQITEILAILYEKTGDFRKSLAYRKAYDELNQELINAETFQKISDLQAEHEKENQEKQIELLEKDQEIQSLQIRRQRAIIAISVLAGLFLGAIALVLYRRFRDKVRSNQMLASAYEQMEELARYDELTGLYNRRSVCERMEIEMVRMGRTWRPFSLAMVDVDDFKKINDQYGHACGDAVLQTLGHIIKDVLRLQDVASRWGGEEFLLMLPETDMEGTFILADKIRKRIEATTFEWEGKKINITVTIGISVYDRPGPISACIERADQALYDGKRTGKNRVVRSR